MTTLLIEALNRKMDDAEGLESLRVVESERRLFS